MRRSVTGFAIATLLAAVAVARCGKPSPTVSDIVITGTQTFVHKSVTAQLAAMANMSSGSPSDVSTTATWATSNAAVATVTSTGLLTTTGNGTAQITATYQSKVGTFNVVVTLTAAPQLTNVLTRLCSPHRARIVITISETSGDIGFDLVSLSTQMLLFGVVEVNHAFTNAELLASLGTLHFNANQSKAVTYETQYPGGIEVEDSTGIVIASFTDDLGHTSSLSPNNIAMHDGC